MAKDPVCGMDVDEKKAATVVHGGKTPLLSKLAGIRPVDRAIAWGYWTRSAGVEIRVLGSAVPISQGPTPPGRP